MHDAHPHSEPDAAELQLSRAGLLAQLGELADAREIGTLRQAVAALRQALVEADGPLFDPDEADLVSIAPAYLDGELDQIGAALGLERARYYIERLSRGVQEARTAAINDINLNRWKTYDDIITDSLWLIDRRDSSGAHQADYWGNFIPQIPHQLMRRYTRPGDWVIDAFAGSGTSLIEGQRLGRNVLGIDLQRTMVERANALVAAEPNPHGVACAAVVGDAATVDYAALLAERGATAARLVILHPPYHDIIRFSENPQDLSNAPSVASFTAMLGGVVAHVAPMLERGRYLALVIGDKYSRGEWVPLGFQAMQAALEQGFTLKSIVVKNFEGTAGKRSQHKLWRYRALAGGFYVFKHEYIFLLRKR